MYIPYLYLLVPVIIVVAVVVVILVFEKSYGNNYFISAYSLCAHLHEEIVIINDKMDH